MRPWDRPDFEVRPLIYSWSCWDPGTIIHTAPRWVHFDGPWLRKALFTPEHDWAVLVDPLRVMISGRNRTVVYIIEARDPQHDVYLGTLTNP